MQKAKYFRRLFFVLTIYLCIAFPKLTVFAQEEADFRILFISSYSYAWGPVQSQIEGLQDGLGSGYSIDYEFMDTKRVNDEISLSLFKEGISYRLHQVAPYDLLIVGDDAALQFALDVRDELFCSIPIVFEGINSEELLKTALKQKKVSGVPETLSIEDNVNLGRLLYPKATKVIAILDDSMTGEAERSRFYANAEKFSGLEFGEINTSILGKEEIKQELSNLTDETILIYITFSEDGDGNQYTDEQAIALVTENAAVATIRMVDAGIGEGVLGGNVVSMYQSGFLAAKITDGILNNKMFQYYNTKPFDSPNTYRIDAKVMEKYALDPKALPEDTEFVNAREGFFRKNAFLLIPGTILIVILGGVLVWMARVNFKRRKLYEELSDAKKIVENASEHDFLTGIPNRNRFMQDLSGLIDAKTPCTVIMIDIDDFKKINDTMGHVAGDDALKQLAERLKKMESQILMPYRYAGDEFILILQSTQERIVEKTALQCRELFYPPFLLEKEPYKVCGSMGIASFPLDAEDLEKLIICADEAMYSVKKSGKNDYAYYRKRSE